MTHPLNQETDLQEGNPFSQLPIDCNEFLYTFENRYQCETCRKSRKFFCYTCYVPHPKLAEQIPRVKLPLKIDIIKHKREIDGKSTAAHAAMLATEDVTVYTYPNIPNYDLEERVVLIFPSHAALTIPQLFSSFTDLEKVVSEFETVEYPKGYNKGTLLKNLSPSTSTSNSSTCLTNQMPVTKAVFIDSTWNQSRGIYKDERISKLPCVVLQNRISQFWRHQRGSPRWYLATIEAIHQLVVEMHINAFGVSPQYKGLSCCFTEESLEKYSGELYQASCNDRAYNGQYDNLLFFFEFMYKLIHTFYDHEQLHAYHRRMK